MECINFVSEQIFRDSIKYVWDSIRYVYFEIIFIQYFKVKSNLSSSLTNEQYFNYLNYYRGEEYFYKYLFIF